MEPCQKIEEIDSSEELASFIAAFRADLKANTRESKNRTLGDFLKLWRLGFENPLTKSFQKRQTGRHCQELFVQVKRVDRVV